MYSTVDEGLFAFISISLCVVIECTAWCSVRSDRSLHKLNIIYITYVYSCPSGKLRPWFLAIFRKMTIFWGNFCILAIFGNFLQFSCSLCIFFQFLMFLFLASLRSTFFSNLQKKNIFTKLILYLSKKNWN